MQGYNERIHWVIFNVVARCFGIMATFAGIGFVCWGIYFTMHPEAAKGLENGGFGLGKMYLIVGAFAGVVGLACLRVRPYRPDLGDTISKESRRD